MSDLGRRIARERLLLGMTQQELAEALETTRDKIGKIETGERDVTGDELVAFARLFEMPAEDLAAPQELLHNRIEWGKPSTPEAIDWFEGRVENALFLDRLPALYGQG